jgi:outer membrane murein-binding lipoprotein Lpp
MPPPPPAEAPREDEKDRVVDKLAAVVKSLEAKIDYLENKLEQKEEVKK